MRARTALAIGGGALVVLGVAMTTAVVAAPHPADPTHVASVASAGAAPGTTAPAATPRPTASLSSADEKLLGYVRTLPGVNDVTADSVGEFTDLTCATLRSPKMSTAFYSQVLTVEQKGYSLTADQANGLLAATAQAACPDARRVVESRGADAATAPVG
ncbi:hypothetical protein [Leifsonia shinshuensis]|uniref:hypothetical protein n=1 Tax=Leifsonia shinshuensis TaxID=150026 RepID=UPI002865D75B|nr:hypothetical protein [Leifsonia shinshuensis]MDR6971098.1 hypothetical protein [Leifsonia shinshuensis]